MTAPAVLVLAGLDPSGAAGILADAEAIRARGARPLCVATALTVQTTRAVRRWEPVAPGLIADSAHALLQEENVRAVKIGMVGEMKIADAIRKLIEPRRDLPVVVDPVLQSTSGALLFKGSLQHAREAYLSLAAGALITPNLVETAALLDLPLQPRDVATMERAARLLVFRGAQAALVKGGHLSGNPVDVLATAAGCEQFEGTRLRARGRGTGCRLSSGIAAGLALQETRHAAVTAARQLVRDHLSRQ